MKVNITGRNFKTYAKLEETIEKKIDKLGKFFSDDITAHVVLSHEGSKDKIETTINAKGTIFRAEESGQDIYECIDKSTDKLASQMAKFKGKLQKRYNDNSALKFEFLPEAEDEAKSGKIVKNKKFELAPMSAEEAVLQMEMLQHQFFVFLDMDTDSVNVVYKRKDGNYGLMETAY
ncbi:MAG: ribosome-associated translation inhibitor RaiA [Peptostreptococcaceae bacterium]|nr:ribosome-associated translation inhibitor RaiA [Peptostreptococcaceae bacterium]MDY5739365.1 ribosome-associated translation inhibitor RaiA [Anaerovoracaceae bacterium]